MFFYHPTPQYITLKPLFVYPHWCVQPPNFTGCTCATVCNRVQPPCYARCVP